MANVMLVQPWSYHDEGVNTHDFASEWRSGPFALLVLGTQLKAQGHAVALVDLGREILAASGRVDACLATLEQAVRRFKPDIIGFSFFSVHYLEVRQAVACARRAAARAGIKPLFVAGGIHASVEPASTITELGVDYAFVGEGDIGLARLAKGEALKSIRGFVGPESTTIEKGEELADLDALPFVDWSLCDQAFYARPSCGRIKFRKARTLDMMLGRGCPHRCGFCAYGKLGSVRLHSVEYVVEEMNAMRERYDIDSIYFLDSTVGVKRHALEQLCERLIESGLSHKLEWYANVRSNQVDEPLLRLMWRAGCRFLFYGFESGSQAVLDRMRKGVTVEDHYRAAQLHNSLAFPFHASVIIGYPGETEADTRETVRFLETCRPPIVGVNWYVPLPGSPDYYRLREEGVVETAQPETWRRIGEVNPSRNYSEMPPKRVHAVYRRLTDLASNRPNRIWRDRFTGRGVTSIARVQLARLSAALPSWIRRYVR